MKHTGIMEFHLEQLAKHCRVCGKRLCKAKGRSQPTHQCSKHTADLVTAFQISTSNDNEHAHPHCFCNNCYRTMTWVVKCQLDGILHHPETSLFEWTEHTLDCPVREILSIQQ